MKILETDSMLFMYVLVDRDVRCGLNMRTHKNKLKRIIYDPTYVGGRHSWHEWQTNSDQRRNDARFHYLHAWNEFHHVIYVAYYDDEFQHDNIAQFSNRLIYE